MKSEITYMIIEIVSEVLVVEAKCFTLYKYTKNIFENQVFWKKK